MHGLYIWARSVRDLSLRWCNAQPRTSRLMRVNAFGLAAGWKLCAKMRLSAFTHIIFRASQFVRRQLVPNAECLPQHRALVLSSLLTVPRIASRSSNPDIL